MKPIGAAAAAAVLLWWTAAGRAAEPVSAPAPLPPEKAFPAAGAASPGCGPCTACTACTRCGACGGGRLWAWLSYRPLHRVQCGECRSCCEGRWVPLYLYFLGECKEHPCSACGGGCSSCGSFGRPTFGAATGWGMFGD